MTRRPNIVLFNPDQWRGDVMGQLGDPGVRTPFTDGLVATDAVAIAQTYCQAVVIGGDETGPVAAQNQASGGVASVVARALPG